MANANDDGARPPELDPSVLRAAITALPIAIEVFAPEGARVFANPAAPSGRKRSATGAPC